MSHSLIVLNAEASSVSTKRKNKKHSIPPNKKTSVLKNRDEKTSPVPDSETSKALELTDNTEKKPSTSM
jgi:hypothetical protein